MPQYFVDTDHRYGIRFVDYQTDVSPIMSFNIIYLRCQTVVLHAITTRLQSQLSVLTVDETEFYVSWSHHEC
jgi:hypothetical protein